MDLREPVSLYDVKLDQICSTMWDIFHRLGNTVILYTQGQHIACKHAFPRESEVVPAYSHTYVKSG